MEGRLPWDDSAATQAAGAAAAAAAAAPVGPTNIRQPSWLLHPCLALTGCGGAGLLGAQGLTRAAGLAHLLQLRRQALRAG